MSRNDAGDRLPLDLRGHDMPPAYATAVVVQHTEDAFVLSFFAAVPPIVLGSHDVPDTVPAHCVARIVMSPSRMAELVEAVNENLAMYQERSA